LAIPALAGLLVTVGPYSARCDDSVFMFCFKLV